MDQFLFFEEKANAARGVKRGYRVDVQTSCGLSFQGVAKFLEVDEKNPLVQIPKPLGIETVKRLLKYYQDVKASEGDAPTS